MFPGISLGRKRRHPSGTLKRYPPPTRRATRLAAIGAEVSGGRRPGPLRRDVRRGRPRRSLSAGCLRTLHPHPSNPVVTVVALSLRPRYLAVTVVAESEGQRLGGAMRYDLPTEVRILQAGLVVNAFGNGAAAPFLIIYLHDVRGVPLALAGLASATSAASALSATLVAGRLADRLGPRPTMLCGLSLSTVAYGLYPFVRQPWHAIGLAVLAGAGIGTWLTMQSALLAQLTPPAMRHIAFAWQRVAANVGLGLGGFAGGVLVTTSRPATFTALFWLNAATFVVYVRFLARIPLPHRHGRDRASAGSYRAVVADRVFVRFTLLNVIV